MPYFPFFPRLKFHRFGLRFSYEAWLRQGQIVPSWLSNFALLWQHHWNSLALYRWSHCWHVRQYIDRPIALKVSTKKPVSHPTSRPWIGNPNSLAAPAGVNIHSFSCGTYSSWCCLHQLPTLGRISHLKLKEYAVYLQIPGPVTRVEVKLSLNVWTL